ncbi:hypothetical protein AB1N83_013971 [Pleurotus pulmonarius]
MYNASMQALSGYPESPWTKQWHQALAATLSTTVTILLAQFTSTSVFALPLPLWNLGRYYREIDRRPSFVLDTIQGLAD